MMIRRTLLGLLLLLCGCGVNPRTEVQAYRKWVDLPSGIADGQTLSLRQAMLFANAANERLSIEGENYLQSLIDKRRAVAAFLPTVALRPAYSRSDNFSSSSGGRTANGTLDIPLAGDINLFNGLSDLAATAAADAIIRQRRWLLLDVQQSLLLDTAQVYYQVLRAMRSVEVLSNSLKVQEQRVADAQARRLAGTARPLDVAQTEAQASATRVSLIAAENEVRTARSMLAFLTGYPVENCELVDGFDPPPATPSLDESFEIASRKRQDLQAAAETVDAARKRVDVAFGRYFPSVSLNLNYFLHRDSAPVNADWTGILRVNVPLFSAGLVHADVRSAWSEFRQSAMARALLGRKIDQEVEASWANLRASGWRLEELHTQLAAARQALDQAEASYKVGLATNLERVTAQDQLLTAQLQLTREGFDRKVYFLNLQRATGSLRTELLAMPATLSAAATTAGIQ